MSKIRPRLWINRLLRNGMKGYVLVFAIALVTLACLVALSSLIDDNIWWNAYYALGINPIENKAVHAHLWLYLFLGVCGAMVFGGLMVMVFTSGVERAVERVRDGQVRYRKLKGHVVIIGWTPITVGLIEQVCRKHPQSQVLVISPEYPANVYTELKASLSPREERRTIVYAYGNGGINLQLEYLSLNRAVELYIALEDTRTFPQPIAQLTLLESIVDTVIQRTSPLRVNVMIDSVESYNTLQRLDTLISNIGKEGKGQMLDIRLFNFYENWARILWGFGGGERFEPLDFEPIEDGEKHVHLVIVGLGEMGKALLLEALRVCHYPTDKSTIISVIDPRAVELQTHINALVPHLDAIKDVEVEFIADSVESVSVRENIQHWCEDEGKLLTIAICQDNPAEAFIEALNLPEIVYCHPSHVETVVDKGNRHKLVSNTTRTRVLVQQTVLHIPNARIAKDRYPHLHFFGTLIPEGANVDLLDDRLAIAINGLYQDNLFGQVLNLDIAEHMNRWTDLWFDSDVTTESFKHASRYQADLFRSTMSIVGRNNLNENPGLTERLAECEHRRWVAERTLMNWRCLREGEYRLDVLRRHDCIVPYDSLPESEKQKDRNVVQFAQHLSDTISVLY